jgi:hypothetical protein
LDSLLMTGVHIGPEKFKIIYLLLEKNAHHLAPRGNVPYESLLRTGCEEAFVRIGREPG